MYHDDVEHMFRRDGGVAIDSSSCSGALLSGPLGPKTDALTHPRVAPLAVAAITSARAPVEIAPFLQSAWCERCRCPREGVGR